MEEEDPGDSELEKGFMAASQVKPETFNKMDKAVSVHKPEVQTTNNDRSLTQYLKKKQAELAALGEWSHIDCLRPSARDDVRDDILRKLVFEKSNTSSVAPKPKSRVDALLSAIDIDDLSVDGASETSRLSVHDVPGGTVSFLFEKSSTAIVEEEDGDEDERHCGKGLL